MNQQLIDMLRDRVQRNCHISDARHGKEYGLCTYLMKMREYFRWERGLGFDVSLSMDEVGDWLTEREQLWSELQDQEFAPLQIDGRDYDPFDVTAINGVLLPQGLAYSGGIGNSGRPHFFLGELEQVERCDGQVRVVSGRDLARDLAAPAAMNRESFIFVRRESLRRLLWEKLEGWRWRRPDNALGRAFACYDFDARLEAALEQMADAELELVLLHERGEHRAGKLLGPQWNEMLLDLLATPAELMARAVRDHLADCLQTLPFLARLERPPSIHFYVGNLTGMRKELFPALLSAYGQWQGGGDRSRLQALAETGVGHWQRVAGSMLQLHTIHESGAAALIKDRLAEWRL